MISSVKGMLSSIFQAFPFYSSSQEDINSLQLGMQVLPYYMRTKITLVNWSAPPVNYFKLNTDRVSRGNPGLAARGGAIRDLNGKLVAAFSSFYNGIHSNLFAKLMALLEGIQLCQKLELQKVVIEVDSMMALNLITKKVKSTWLLDCLAQLIQQHLSIIDFIALHIFREGNKLADLLANIGCDEKCNRLYDSSNLPFLARGVLRLDRISCLYLRISSKNLVIFRAKKKKKKINTVLLASLKKHKKCFVKKKNQTR
ncbi:hypothetical protein ACH5RR_027006 [Cinchona calisaya]|uniref:RNase H type-1 domain-containing protein n=1 Tax=Cinchona calisaya TaxID=153742 RepID=A0ABD2Z483_9GENT